MLELSEKKWCLEVRGICKVPIVPSEVVGQEAPAKNFFGLVLGSREFT